MESYKLQDSKHGRWLKQEDLALSQAVQEFGEKQWRLISERVPGRNPIQCLHRWSKILKPGLIKGSWSAAEDRQLYDWVEKNGPTQWSLCSRSIPGRSGKQCRQRWSNTLSPVIKKGNWNPQQDSILFQMYQTYGPKWTLIAKSLQGRSENSIKNRFYSTIRKLKALKKEKNQVKTGSLDKNTCLDQEINRLVEQVRKLEYMLKETRLQIYTLENNIKEKDDGKEMD